MGLIDTHTHLDAFFRSGVLPAVVERAQAAGLEAMIAVGTEPDDWRIYRDVVREYPGMVFHTVGLHPCSVDEHWEPIVDRMKEFLESEAPGLDSGVFPPAPGGAPAGSPCPRGPVAVGEIGLDRFHLPEDPAVALRVFSRQREAFTAQLVVARTAGVPVVVHSRGAFRECVDLIDASGFDWRRVVFHCFSEGADEMNAVSRRGGYGSFTGIITYKNADGVRAAARAQGLERLMIETDAPYLAPLPHRGKPNEPAYVRATAEYCAALFDVPFDELAAITTANARRFFGI